MVESIERVRGRWKAESKGLQGTKQTWERLHYKGDGVRPRGRGGVVCVADCLFSYFVCCVLFCLVGT